ncbi:MAG: 16S rRNA (cytosine(967)-C(5))-methyltransferase RsmB [Clostridia bacterium]|nr:16S rRNA (cytosine(967)-C(5))-methyltransferase RsmB [Clostridia bacterium]
MKSARRIAYDILYKVYMDSAYSNIALDSALEEEKPDVKDRAFISMLVYGVAERTVTLDYQLSLYLTQPLKKLKPQVLVILRMGVYQLLFTDKIPPSAAVNESVKLSKQCGCAYASGLINAVLRKVASGGLRLPDKKDEIYFYSVKYSCPEWMIKLWEESYGRDNALKLCEASTGGAPTVLRVNTLKITQSELKEALKNEGVESTLSDVVDNALIVRNSGSLRELESYRSGLFHVQDIASQLCVRALGAKEGESVLDICSAPGGKAFTAAQYMKNSGKITACDIYEHRLKLIDNSAQRLGIDIIETMLNDASVFNGSIGMYDKILCDVPCSGLGIIRRKPEIRFKTAAEVDKLPEIQYSIMKTASLYLKKGGIMVYSTCSLNSEENEKIYNKFLSENPDFEPVAVLPDIARCGGKTDHLTLMPHIHGSDGFFISAVRRRADD